MCLSSCGSRARYGIAPVFDVKKRRPEPKFLAVQDVRVATGYGAIFVRSTEGEAAPGGQMANAPPPPRAGAPVVADRMALIRNAGGNDPEANVAARPRRQHRGQRKTMGRDHGTGAGCRTDQGISHRLSRRPLCEPRARQSQLRVV